jgi:hypothetical protein
MKALETSAYVVACASTLAEIATIAGATEALPS